MKRFLSLLLCLILCLSLIPAGAFAAEFTEEEQALDSPAAEAVSEDGDEPEEANTEAEAEEADTEAEPEEEPEAGDIPTEEETEMPETQDGDDEDEEPEESVPITVRLSGKRTRLRVNEILTLEVFTEPESIADSELIWTSSDKGVLIVNGSGTVVGIAEGTATVRACVWNNEDIYDELELTVLAADAEIAEENEAGEPDGQEENSAETAEETEPAAENGLSGAAVSEPSPFEGLGTTEEPWIISSEKELRLLAEKVNTGVCGYAGAYYVLSETIELTELWTPIGTVEHPFTGGFDGAGHALRSLSLAGGEYSGLFGVAENAVITRLALEDTAVEADSCPGLGAAVGLMRGGSLSECYATGSISTSGGSTGGLVGVVCGGTVRDCFNCAVVSSAEIAGGIAGTVNNGAVVSTCYGAGRCTSETWRDMGFVAGAVVDAEVTLCYAVNGADPFSPTVDGDNAAQSEAFSGFDFDCVWAIEGADHPYLRNNYNPGLLLFPVEEIPEIVLISSPEDSEAYDVVEDGLVLGSNSASSLPSSYDLRDEGLVTAVRNQNPYGTCWAFSALAAAESNILKNYDTETDLSELQLVWFHSRGARKDDGTYNDPLGNFGGDRGKVSSNILNAGAILEDVFYTLANWMGVVEEDSNTDYANAEYVASEGLPYSYAFEKDAYHLSDVRMAKLTNRDDVKRLILEYGAVSISYMHDARFFDDTRYTGYYGACYYAPAGESYSGSASGHAVSIVGWDDSFSRYNFNSAYRPDSDGAWLVRNSWSENANMNGYFWLSYESRIASNRKYATALGVEPADNYQYCYQYDGGCSTGEYTFVTEYGYEANVFTAQGSQMLSAVSFWLPNDSNVPYTIYIRRNLTGDSPEGGSQVLVQTGCTGLPGYYTVRLDNDIVLRDGEKFAVIIRFENTDGYLDIPYDTNSSTAYGSYSVSQEGQSFISRDGEEWVDYGALGTRNLRIKAFTSDTPAAAGSCGEEMSWLVQNDGTLVISGKGSMYDYTADSPAPWSSYASLITAVAIGENVESIGSRAFAAMRNIVTVSLPDSLVSIGSEAFADCNHLSSITLPAAVESFGSSVFSGYCVMKELYFTGSAPAIGENAFSGMVNARVFYPAADTTWTYELMTQYGGNVRWVPDTLYDMGSFGDGIFWTLDRNGGLNITGSGAMSVASSSTNIPWHDYRSIITSVTVGESVTEISRFAFSDCPCLDTVIFEGNAPKLYDNCLRSSSVHAVYLCGKSGWDESVLTDYGGSVVWQKRHTGLDGDVCSVCGSHTGSCGEDAVWELDSNGVLTISGSGETYSYSGSSVPWASYRESIGTLSVGDGITALGAYSVSDCDRLEAVSLPETLTGIGAYAFSGCEALDAITLPAGLENISQFAFYQCRALESVTIPAKVSSIGSAAFSSCDSLTSVSVSGANSTYKSVGGVLYSRDGSALVCCPAAFTGEFKVPSTVTEISARAFQGCARLTAITLPEHLTDIGISAFRDCSLLGEIIVPSEITVIRRDCFYNCPALESVTIPASVSEIKDSAFSGCTAIKAVYYNGIASQWDSIKMGTDNTCLTGAARYYTAKFTVTYDANGGTGAPEKQGKTCGETLILRDAVPVRRGYNFLGWAESKDAVSAQYQAGGKYTADADATLYAVWETIRYTVSFDANGGENAPEKQEKLFGQTLTLTDAEPTREGWSFLGWAESKDAASAKYKAGGAYSADADITLFAVWKRITYTVSYNANGGYGAPTRQEKPHGEALTLSSAVPKRSGYIFLGWSTDKNADTPQYQPGSIYTVNANLALYALWEGPYLASGNCGDGITWKIDDSFRLTIGGSGRTGDFAEGRAPWAGYANKIKTLNVGEGVEYLGSYSFTLFIELTDIYYPGTAEQWAAIVSVTGNDALNSAVLHCGSGNEIDVTSLNFTSDTEVWIDGKKAQLIERSGRVFASTGVETPTVMTAHTIKNSGEELHARYPISMKVYMIEDGAVRYVPELDNLLTYSGTSIRISGVKGIRCVTSVNEELRGKLINTYAGYTLEEYGTLMCWASNIVDGSLTFGDNNVGSAFAYKKGVADPIFRRRDGMIQYTNVLTVPTLEKWKDDVAMRPYIILRDSDGQSITIYGGIVYRSVGYVAYQNRSAFEPGTDGYRFIWEIIHTVYGDVYDEEYKG